MRQFALGLLILIAAPTIAWGDAYDDLKKETECRKLIDRGDTCVEYVWTELGEVKRGPKCVQTIAYWDNNKRDEGQYRLVGTRVAIRSAGRLTPRQVEIARSCKCNRHAYQDFGFGERTKYHWCQARY